MGLSVLGQLWQRHLAYLTDFMNKPAYRSETIRLGLNHRKNFAQSELLRTTSPAYLDLLVGTLGADPSLNG